MMAHSKDKQGTMTLSLGAAIEQSLQLENQQIKPVNAAKPGMDYRKMLDILDKTQTAKEVQAAFSPY